MKRLTIILSAVCVLQAAVIVYLWTAKQDAHRFQYVSGSVAFDSKTGQVCYTGTEEAREQDDNLPRRGQRTTTPYCKDLR